MAGRSADFRVMPAIQPESMALRTPDRHVWPA
jgi:hypothetical protein